MGISTAVEPTVTLGVAAAGLSDWSLRPLPGLDPSIHWADSKHIVVPVLAMAAPALIALMGTLSDQCMQTTRVLPGARRCSFSLPFSRTWTSFKRLARSFLWDRPMVLRSFCRKGPPM